MCWHGGSGPDEPLPEISRELLAQVPPGTGWAGHFGDRSFQQAEYLLDPAACRGSRTWEQRELTTAYRVIFGVEKFAGHAGSWRCSTSAFLAASAERIDALDVAAARRAFSVAEMADLGLYEVRPEEDDDNAFVRVLIRLREFGAHCRRVAAKDLDLIIELY